MTIFEHNVVKAETIKSVADSLVNHINYELRWDTEYTNDPDNGVGERTPEWCRANLSPKGCELVAIEQEILNALAKI